MTTDPNIVVNSNIVNEDNMERTAMIRLAARMAVRLAVRRTEARMEARMQARMEAWMEAFSPRHFSFIRAKSESQR